MTPPNASDDADLRIRLRALRVDPQGATEFAAVLHRRLAEAAAPAAPGSLDGLRALFQRRPGIAWPALGLATAVGAFALLMVLRPGVAPGLAGSAPASVIAAAPPAADPALVAADYRVPSSKVAVIRLNFSADVAVRDADFRVALPEGLAFWGEEGKLADRSFHWKQDLGAGDTTVPIAVRGELPGRYKVTATAVAGGHRIEHEVWLEVTEG